MTRKHDITLICENIRSLWNVGAMFRSADAFGISKIYLCGYTGRPPQKEISKVALGAEKWVRWEAAGSAWQIICELKKKGYNVYALEQTKTSRPIQSFRPKFPAALIVGNELAGVSEDALAEAHCAVHIVMSGRKESLNVAVAAGIAMYQFSLRRKQ